MTPIGEELHIRDDRGHLLCKHLIPESKGHSVINRNHKRSRSATIDQLIAQTSARFLQPDRATYLPERICRQKGRYIRDHVQAIAEAILTVDASLVSTVLDTCLHENYISATLFRELMALHLRETKKEPPDTTLAKVILVDPASGK